NNEYSKINFNKVSSSSSNGGHITKDIWPTDPGANKNNSGFDSAFGYPSNGSSNTKVDNKNYDITDDNIDPGFSRPGSGLYDKKQNDKFIGSVNGNADSAIAVLPSFGGKPVYGSNGNSGIVSMNPEKLYNTALNGMDLESRVNANFQSLDGVFEELINSVQTPELNSQLKSLYDTFRKVENDFDRNNQVINNFFENQLQKYGKLAQNISDATGNLTGSIGFDNKVNSDKNVMPISGHVTKDIWATDPGANKGNSGTVDVQPVKPVYSEQGDTSNLEPTKVYTYDEVNGLREATNVGYKSDYDLMHDTAFGVTPNGSSNSSTWSAYDGNKRAGNVDNNK
ncbi:MAG: hypothetical protein MR550_03620, partial [Bacilli bacterium]|nr:hypothetical protein [Bacilli bacterium]